MSNSKIQTRKIYQECMEKARTILLLSEENIAEKCISRIRFLKDTNSKCDCGNENPPDNERIWCQTIRNKIILENNKEIKELGLKLFRDNIEK